MLEAVLFDWGDTLVHWAWDVALLEAGHTAGLRALGLEPVPELTDRFVETYLPLLDVPGQLEEVGYEGLVRQMLAEAGIVVDESGAARFVEAEHETVEVATQLAATTHALLETLRERGLKVGIVSNAFDPPTLIRRDLERLGIAERIDVAVFSSEVGRRKPDPVLFERALETLGVEPEQALFVGDSLAADIGGAAAIGMHTCQALWFRADDDPAGPEPEFQAFTQIDVLTAVKRLS